MVVPSVGASELLIILAIILLPLRAKKLPELARSLGKAKKEFKEGMVEEEKKQEPEKPKKTEKSKKEKK